ncbi:response regulator transcription factor [Streptomyces sp. NPDC048527]|uniref:response regulator transcription factor n=1 Tax=Streptomyces sp. NPDC048527 TaxID=3365568 RepID=UPI003715D227
MPRGTPVGPQPYGVRLGVRGAPQRPKSSRQALSAAEGHIAEFVGQGLPNPDIDIAGQLMLSRRTVGTHVSHIFAKLQVRSRREVAERARVEPEPASGR